MPDSPKRADSPHPAHRRRDKRSSLLSSTKQEPDDKDTGALSPESFRSQQLTPAKKLRSPVRLNEDSSASSDIPALIKDLRITPPLGRKQSDRPQEQQQQQQSPSSSSSSPRLTTTILGARWLGSSPTSPLAAKGRRQSRGSSLAHEEDKDTLQGRSEQDVQDVLDAMVGDLHHEETHRQEQQEDLSDDVIMSRSQLLHPAKKLPRRDRRSLPSSSPEPYDSKQQQQQSSSTSTIRAEPRDTRTGKSISPRVERVDDASPKWK